MRQDFAVKEPQIISFIEESARLAKMANVSISDVIVARHTLELARSNKLYRENGEAFDEQARGICEILKKVVNAVQSIGAEEEE